MHAMSSCCKCSRVVITKRDDDNEQVPMPGFRFHPTDEELVGFYLRRKVENEPPIKNEPILEIDIYDYEPWDLPKTSDNHGGNEWYFFSKRVQKYKNSTRPNRVTTSGFWKVTDIDKPVLPEGEDNRGCIGLRKTLMYYRGRAGRGTKTDWTMHEFRLLCDNNYNTSIDIERNISEQAEVWTLCKITKRNSPYRNQLPLRPKRSAKSCSESSGTYCDDYQIQELSHPHDEGEMDHSNAVQFSNQTPDMASSSNSNMDEQEFYGKENWDELAQVVQMALSTP